MIDISKDRYDEIMAMDWKNCRRFFDEELRAIHDSILLEKCKDCISRQAVLDLIAALKKSPWFNDDTDETYSDIKKGKIYSSFRDVPLELVNAIANGVPLPKGHGRIVDISKIDEDRIESDNPVISLMIGGECIEAISLDYLAKLSTIIKADKENDR